MILIAGGMWDGNLFVYTIDDNLWAPQLSAQKLLNFSKSALAEISVYGRPTTGEIENDHLATKRHNSG